MQASQLSVWAMLRRLTCTLLHNAAHAGYEDAFDAAAASASNLLYWPFCVIALGHRWACSNAAHTSTRLRVGTNFAKCLSSCALASMGLAEAHAIRSADSYQREGVCLQIEYYIATIT